MGRTSATLLPDDVLCEILLRVSADVADLFRCALTCKRWRSLVADPSFLRLRWPENLCHPSFLLGFFDRRWNEAQPPFFSTISTGSVPGTRHHSLASFISGASDGGVLNGLSPLVAQSGFLSMHVAGDPGTNTVRLAVCNPVTGTFYVLPALCCSSVVISREDCCSGNGQEATTPSMGHSIFFKVLAIVRGRHDQDCNIYTYVSSQPKWSAPRKCFDDVWLRGKCGCRILHGRNHVALCRGVAHWLGQYWTEQGEFTHYYTFDVNVKTGHISLTKLLIPGNQLAVGNYSRLLLNVTEERLSLFHLHEEGPRLSTWTRGDDRIWLRTRLIELKVPTQVWQKGCANMCWGEKSGTLFIMDMQRCVYKTNIETGAMENVMTKMFKNRLDIMEVPMEIDWPAFFMFRLGVGRSSQRKPNRTSAGYIL